TVPLIASGGAGTAAHFTQAALAGADAVLAASVFHFGTLTVAQVKEDMRAAGLPVRQARRAGALERGGAVRPGGDLPRGGPGRPDAVRGVAQRGPARPPRPARDPPVGDRAGPAVRRCAGPRAPPVCHGAGRRHARWLRRAGRRAA